MTLVSLIVAALLQVQAAPAARVRNVVGDVDLIRAADTGMPEAGDIVFAGDRIHTLKGASLALSMETGAALVLKSDSSLEIKSVNGESVAFLTEGSINVRSSGKPALLETKYGRIIGTEDFQEFEVNYSGDLVQVLLIGGAVRAEVSDSSKVVFKNAYDRGARIYEAGSISPTVPQTTTGTTVIVYPEVGNSAPDRRRPMPPAPSVPPK